MEKIFTDDFLKKLNKINMNISLRLSSGYQGGRKSKAKGVSVEFSDYREYIKGDDFRRVDWNAYGRFDKLFIKVFMEEREGIFNFFLDTSKSMDYGVNNKRVMALKIVASLSYIAINNLDRVNITALDSGNINQLKQVAGSKAFENMLASLESVEFKGNTKLSTSIKKRPIKAKGVSVVVSDFLDDNGLEDLEDGLKYLAYKNQQILLIQVLAKEEINPEGLGEVSFIDSENNEEVKLSLTEAVIKEYKSTLKGYQDKIEKMAKKYGGKFIVVDSSMEIEEVILEEFPKKRLLH